MLIFVGVSATAATRYVDLNSPNPTPPYTTWLTAATKIQEAVDAANLGDEVLVADGVYASGGRVVYGTMTNRVTVTNAIVLRSVNGPQFTVIAGRQVSGSTNGDGAIRCVYLGNGAVLSGFTLTNGATRNSGDWDFEQSGGGVWCANSGATVTNCVIVGNAAQERGGGTRSGSLWDCLLIGNSTRRDGGGASLGLLNRCVITNNQAGGEGGGIYLGTPQNCTIVRNSAGTYGGGVAGSSVTAVNCMIAYNTAKNQGGGVYYATLRNCALVGNSASDVGGGGYGCTLYNCTITGNSAGNSGGGGWGSSYYNCIVYYNSARLGANYGGSLKYSCTTPLPASGAGNITNEPAMASAYHLGVDSPCRGLGSANYASGLDIDGESWLGPPSMGCDEFVSGLMVGPLFSAVRADYTNIAVGFTASFTADIMGHAGLSRWDFGDGSVVTNQPYISHSWAVPGAYPVVLTVYNNTHPGGVSATSMVQVVTQPVHYVRATGSSPAAPYGSWATAANNIQSAVNAATVAGALVLVTNGTYNSGGAVVHGSMFNRVAVTKPLIVQSVNGPAVTLIQGRKDFSGPIGDGAIRGVYLAPGARLSGFTVTNSATRGSGQPITESTGGGAFCETATAVVTNCILINNAAQSGGGISGGTVDGCRLVNNFAGEGGGAYNATVNNCTLTNNSVAGSGGGVAGGVLSDCLIVGNSASSGGGANGGVLNRCVLSNNVALYDGGGGNNSILNYSLISSNAAGSGGGAAGGTLNGCILVSNVVFNSGGGASGSNLRGCAVSGNFAAYAAGGVSGGTAVNCTIVGNIAGVFAGGVASCNLTNSVVFFNSATNGENFKTEWNPIFYNSCTTPLPESGSVNFTNAPLFVDEGSGDLRLQSDSPCINAGNNSYATASGTDLDGNLRVVGGTVDVGAYEFQSPSSVLSYAWAHQNGLPTDGSADFTDADGDAMNNYGEWRAGTVPTNAVSALRLLTPSVSVTGVLVSWQSIGLKKYWLERSEDLSLPMPFQIVATNITGTAGTKTFTDTSATNDGPYFYRVGVH